MGLELQLSPQQKQSHRLLPTTTTMLFCRTLPAVLLTALLTLTSSVTGAKLIVPEIREKHELTFAFDFPKRFQLGVFPSGKTGKVRFNITNTGNDKVTVFRVATTYTKPKDFTKKVSRSPAKDLSFTILPKKTIVYNHHFATDIEAQEANLQIAFDCEDYDSAGESYRVIALNHPVTIVYDDSLFDVKSIVMYIFSSVLFGLVSYFFYTVFFYTDGSKSTKTKKSRPAPSQPEAEAEPATEPKMEWIPDHVLQEHKKAAGTKTRKRK
ncbi:hypothetical protein BASA50_006627 [Batrachochytrium salamandrivorans]|uniref:Translocon-associated protein subunit alpha n=1 Tax=Batrachochytrium salamandrivorans TaxID=1357716 RepID=A0ABQ8F969_9FUNG|nr:hypothetical protein BASA62_000267 [Batrachochytrium salamandrivorans]KAH6560400.1 hypothetical protein BASA60_000321 [Batrachochytrium salamandrivorans]KAH6594380.1 hypothetical protein BASA50_006627 [Batrachochytrium salamandrivorans]KAH9249226.1 hypothetical protein BASA81_013075 [Batrachochytrium salamandrivorans]KAH9274841.1 hypothetical protein BASA83_002551 [Batrachochytrium salamandrivorans]